MCSFFNAISMAQLRSSFAYHSLCRLIAGADEEYSTHHPTSFASVAGNNSPTLCIIFLPSMTTAYTASSDGGIDSKKLTSPPSRRSTSSSAASNFRTFRQFRDRGANWWCTPQKIAAVDIRIVSLFETAQFIHNGLVSKSFPTAAPKSAGLVYSD